MIASQEDGISPSCAAQQRVYDAGGITTAVDIITKVNLRSLPRPGACLVCVDVVEEILEQIETPVDIPNRIHRHSIRCRRVLAPFIDSARSPNLVSSEHDVISSPRRGFAPNNG